MNLSLSGITNGLGLITKATGLIVAMNATAGTGGTGSYINRIGSYINQHTQHASPIIQDGLIVGVGITSVVISKLVCNALKACISGYVSGAEGEAGAQGEAEVQIPLDKAQKKNDANASAVPVANNTKPQNLDTILSAIIHVAYITQRTEDAKTAVEPILEQLSTMQKVTYALTAAKHKVCSSIAKITKWECMKVPESHIPRLIQDLEEHVTQLSDAQSKLLTTRDELNQLPGERKNAMNLLQAQIKDLDTKNATARGAVTNLRESIIDLDKDLTQDQLKAIGELANAVDVQGKLPIQCQNKTTLKESIEAVLTQLQQEIKTRTTTIETLKKQQHQKHTEYVNKKEKLSATQIESILNRRITQSHLIHLELRARTLFANILSNPALSMIQSGTKLLVSKEKKLKTLGEMNREGKRVLLEKKQKLRQLEHDLIARQTQHLIESKTHLYDQWALNLNQTVQRILYMPSSLCALRSTVTKSQEALRTQQAKINESKLQKNKLIADIENLQAQIAPLDQQEESLKLQLHTQKVAINTQINHITLRPLSTLQAEVERLVATDENRTTLMDRLKNLRETLKNNNLDERMQLIDQLYQYKDTINLPQLNELVQEINKRLATDAQTDRKMLQEQKETMKADQIDLSHCIKLKLDPSLKEFNEASEKLRIIKNQIQ